MERAASSPIYLLVLLVAGMTEALKSFHPHLYSLKKLLTRSHRISLLLLLPISNRLDQGISCRRVVVLMVLLILQNLGVKVPLQQSSTRDTKFYDSIKAMKRE